MSRDRMIPSDFWNDPDLAALSREARFFYLGIWGLADDYQVLHNDTRRCKAAIYPYDSDVTIEFIQDLIAQLISSDRLRAFDANGGSFLYVTYSKPWEGLRRPRNSDLPRPPYEIHRKVPQITKSAESFGKLRNPPKSSANSEIYRKVPQIPKSAESFGKFPLYSIVENSIVENSIVENRRETADAVSPEKESNSNSLKTTENSPKSSAIPNLLRKKPETETKSSVETTTPVLETLTKYFQNEVGLISPAILEELEDFAGTYKGSLHDIELAFREMAASGKRSWKYVRAIMENWQSQGGPPPEVLKRLGEVTEPPRKPDLRFSKRSEIEPHTQPRRKHCPEAKEMWVKIQEDLKKSSNKINYQSFVEPIHAVGYLKDRVVGQGEVLVLAGPEFVIANLPLSFKTQIISWVKNFARVSEILYVTEV